MVSRGNGAAILGHSVFKRLELLPFTQTKVIRAIFSSQAHKRSCSNRSLSALKQLSIALAPMLLQHLVGKHALPYAPASRDVVKTDSTRSNSTPAARPIPLKFRTRLCLRPFLIGSFKPCHGLARSTLFHVFYLVDIAEEFSSQSIGRPNVLLPEMNLSHPFVGDQRSHQNTDCRWTDSEHQ